VTGGFVSTTDCIVGDAFLREGYVIRPVEDRPALDRIQARVAELAAKSLGIDPPNDPKAFLDDIHDHVKPDTLNAFRLAMIAGINAEPWFRRAYYGLAEQALAAIVGNELAMQRRANLSIQLPDDESSLLPAHTDTWSGDSPFEVVVWLPLVDCRATKSMFILPPAANARAAASLAGYDGKGVEALYRDYESEMRFLTVEYGQFLLFDQNLIHGNRINREPSTRWTFNCRFKGLFTPYADKRLGEFFEPITMRPATRLGLAYKLPEGFGG
jgi:sporadic carbohydrate cluster 2OG-Fe(II) oxygenase